MKSKTKQRNWTKDETELFTEILADPDQKFLDTLERKALKKEKNRELFEEMKAIFDVELFNPDFVEKNRINSMRKGEVLVHTDPDTSVPRLLDKYKNLKSKWTAITEDARTGSGLTGTKDEYIVPTFNPFFSETRGNLEEIASGVFDTSILEQDETERQEIDGSDDESDSDSDVDNDDEPPTPTGPATEPVAKKRKGQKALLVESHKKRDVVRSQTQGLSQLANGIRDLAQSQAMRHREEMKETKRRRDTTKHSWSSDANKGTSIASMSCR